MDTMKTAENTGNCTELRSVGEKRPLLISEEKTELEINGVQTVDAVKSVIQVASTVDISEEHQPECTESFIEEPFADNQEFGFRQNEITANVEESSVIIKIVSDMKCKLQNGADLECGTVKPSGLKNEGENEELEKASNSELPTTPVVQNSFSLPSIHSLDDPSIKELCEDSEENKVKKPKDPNNKEANAEEILDTVLQSIDGKNCCDGETHSQTVKENEPVEPPAKKKLRKRMGMCGLGERKRKFPFDGQQYRHGVNGGERGKVPGSVDIEDTDGLKNSTIVVNDSTVLISDKGSVEQLVLEDILEQQVPSTEQNINEGQDQCSTVMKNSHKTTNASSNGETSTNVALFMKFKDVSEEEELHIESKWIESNIEVAEELTEDLIQVCKFDSIGVPKQLDEGTMDVIPKDQDCLTGLEEMEMDMLDLCPPEATHNVDLSATVKKRQSIEDGIDPLFLAHVVTVSTPTSDDYATLPDVDNKIDLCSHMELQCPSTSFTEQKEPSDSSSDEMATALPVNKENHDHFCDSVVAAAVTDLPQEPEASVPLSPFCSVTDSQLNYIALSMELDGHSVAEHHEDVNIIGGLIQELSYLNRTVMAAHREMELFQLGNRPQKPPILRKYDILP